MSRSPRFPHEQLPLAIGLRTDATFDNFVVAAANTAAIHALRAWLEQGEAGVFYLSGPSGSGRSHLLQAACQQLRASGADGAGAFYLPLRQLATQSPAELLEGLDAVRLLCLDDIDAVLGDPIWAEQLFHLFNRLMARGGQLLVAAPAPAPQIECALPDLRSRLSWGGSFHLRLLDDAGRRRLLQVRARERGFDIAEDVAAFILNRHARDVTSILLLLEKLDQHSLVHKKRVTITLVRQLLDRD
jgi:DnaA family protein